VSARAFDGSVQAFRDGDRLICMESGGAEEGCPLQVGKIYTIKYTVRRHGYPPHKNIYVHLVEHEGGWASERFDAFYAERLTLPTEKKK
jgi:hypothetical protein